MKFGIYSNITRDIKGKAGIDLAEFLLKNNIDFALCDELSFSNIKCDYYSNENLAINCDLVVVFGGDGTVLHYGKICAKHNTPMFAVNVGRVGFLSECDLSNLFENIIKINNGDYLIEKRNLLKVDLGDKNYYALNDCIITRDVHNSLIELDYYVNDTWVSHIRGDALVIATPTGSTAYSLSGGGPIVAPDVKGILITPICPYTLFSRPLIVGQENIVTIKTKPKCIGYINIDGEDILNLKGGEVIKISKADVKVNFIRMKENGFYEKISKKNKTMQME